MTEKLSCGRESVMRLSAWKSTGREDFMTDDTLFPEKYINMLRQADFTPYRNDFPKSAFFCHDLHYCDFVRVP